MRYFTVPTLVFSVFFILSISYADEPTLSIQRENLVGKWFCEATYATESEKVRFTVTSEEINFPDGTNSGVSEFELSLNGDTVK